MLAVAKATYCKNRITNKRVYPLSFMLSRIFGGIIDVCFPAFIYYLLFKGHVSGNFAQYAGTSDYMTYVVLGQSSSIIAFATLMNVGRCMISEIREGTLDTFLLSPASRMGYFLGCYIEQLGRSVIEFSAVLIVGILLGARLTFERILLTILFILFLSLACFAVSILISSVMVFTRDTYITQNTFFQVMNFICGVYFPTQFLPKWLQGVSELLPLTPSLKMFRNCVLNGQGFMENLPLLIQTILLSIIYILIGYFWFRKSEKRLVEQVYA